MPTPNLSDIDLRLLRVFQGVVRHNGFSAAQGDLGLTQATISNHMTQLEERLGMRLCERGRGGFYLTDYGKLIYEATLNLFRSIDNFHGIVGSTRGELLGELHFGTVDAMYTNEELNLPKILKTFSDIAPRVIIQIDMASPQRLLQGLLEERYHVILGPVGKLPSSIRSWSLMKEEQSLFCGAAHPLFAVADKDISIKDLSKMRFAGRSYTSDTDLEVGIDFEWSAIASHMESIALLILSGGYIGYLPTHYAEQSVRQGKMRRLLSGQTTYIDQFHLAHRQQERNSVAHRFVECVLKQKAN
jgi:LysR family transcriptional regulator, transcriptional activator for bauABCD operon